MEAKGGRADIYKDPTLERLLIELYEKGSRLEPQFDLEHGYRYPGAESLTGLRPDEAKAALEKLAGSGILTKEPFDRETRCPSCGSSNVATNYTCPHDGSLNLARDALIEHLACGYIDVTANFRQGEELVCPRCKATLTPGSSRVAGSWSRCSTCGRRLEALAVQHKCRRCGAKFDYDQARFEEVYAYSLSGEAKADIERGVLYTSQLRNALEGSGYTVRSPPAVRGASGIDYEFDIVAVNREGGEVTVDVDFSTEAKSRDKLMAEYGKLADTRKESYLVVAPPLSEELGKLAESLGMRIIQAEKPTEAMRLLAQRLALKETPRELVAEKAAEKERPKERIPQPRGIGKLLGRMKKTG